MVLIGILMASLRSIFYLISVAGILYAIYKIYYRLYDIWVVTNLRVIDEYGLFTHYAFESPLDKINNISFSQTLWGRQMGYGNVMIQTAASHGTTTYFGVENPNELKDSITNMQEEYRHPIMRIDTNAIGGVAQNSQSESNSSIADELEKIYVLKQKGILTEDEFNNLKIKILKS